ncbi:MAG: hypothetical protein GY724_04545 [Actinomycetia bacterium]|nr:hypothetical protein [Actinomycetes bacterium]
MATIDPLFLYCLTLEDRYHNIEHWTDETHATIERHAAFLDGLGAKGQLAFAGRTLYDPGHTDLFGIAVIRASSMEAAHEMMADDPSVLQGVQRAVIHPFSMGIRHLSRFENEAPAGSEEAGS